MGLLAISCNKKVFQRQKEMVQRLKVRDNTQRMRRVNTIEDSEEESITDDGDDKEEQLVLRVDGKEPFYMEGMMCDKYFKAIIDTGSPVSIFTKTD